MKEDNTNLPESTKLRQKAEAKLEKDLQAIIENSFESVWSINADYEIQYVNEQFVREFQKTFGVKLAKGVNILEALPDPLNILWKERYDRAFNNEHFVFTDKIDLVHTILYIEVAMNPIVVNGKVTGVSLYGKDITERIRIEESLKMNEEKFRKLFENSPVGISLTGFDGSIYLNKSGIGIIGYPEEEMNGKKWLDITYPDDVTMTTEALQSLLDGKCTQVRFEKRYIHKNGSIVWVDISMYLESDSAGNPTSYVKIFNDITGRKQMETELIAAKVKAEESEQQLIIGNKELMERNSFIQTILDNLPIGIALNKIDEGTATYMNKKFQEIYGWSSDEIISIGSFFENVYPDADYRNKLIGQIIADIQSGDPERMHWENIFVTQKDGGKRVVNAVNIPLMEQNTMVSTVIDITELHKTQNDLVAAKEKAEESDRLKSAFLANMSHELRTPLNSIIGFSELMTDPDHDAENHVKFAQMINNSGNNLLSIINDLMDISKIEAGQVQVRNAPVYVNYLIADIQKEYSYKAVQKGIVLRINQLNPIEEIVIESDESKLRQILINFVGNAIKFTETGFIEIGINKTDNFCQFYVKDTGIGIPGKFHDTIFERFRQVETVHTRKYGGNGLGLAISKSLVELLGGTIWMESEVGNGSTFSFSIPNIENH